LLLEFLPQARGTAIDDPTLRLWMQFGKMACVRGI
jgi:hypothetical protein